MKYFLRNVLRGAFLSKGTYIGAATIIAIGVFLCICMLETLGNLEGRINIYYRENRLGDIFAEVSGISASDLSHLEDLPGIREASGALSMDVRIMGEAFDSVSSVHLIGYDKDMPLNRPNFIGSGDFSSETIFIGKRMTADRNLMPGEEVGLIFAGKRVPFVVSGSVFAPHYIYVIPPSGAIVSDGREYDIAYIEKSRLETLSSRAGIYNELSFSLEEGISFDEIRENLRSALEPYGLISMTERAKQVSVEMVEGEVDELVSMGTVLPLLFMGMSLFMLYTVLKRIIEKDRIILGTMKAMGMKNKELVGAYLLLALFIGMLGNLLGIGLGIPAGKAMYSIYQEFFSLPPGDYIPFYSLRIGVGIFVLFFSMGAVFIGVKDILKIDAAESMRPKSPTALGVNPLVERIGGKVTRRLGVRSVFRSPLRSVGIILAIAFPFGMASALYTFSPTIDSLFEQMTASQNFDLKIFLTGYETQKNVEAAALGIRDIYGAEAVCEMPVYLEKGNRSGYYMLYGVNENSRLLHIYDYEGGFHLPKKDGLIINSRLAAELDVSEGETLLIRAAGSDSEKRAVPVIKIILERIGGGAYLAMDGIENYLGISRPSNVLLLTLPKGKKESVNTFLQGLSSVLSVTDTQEMLTQYRERFATAKNLIDTFIFMTVVAGVILIYNVMMISVRERNKEFATLKVLGMSGKELLAMLSVEQGIYLLAGILAGIPIAHFINFLIEEIMYSDSYSFEMTIGLDSYVKSALICILIILFSTAYVFRLIKKIDPAESLKERE